MKIRSFASTSKPPSRNSVCRLRCRISITRVYRRKRRKDYWPQRTQKKTDEISGPVRTSCPRWLIKMKRSKPTPGKKMRNLLILRRICFTLACILAVPIVSVAQTAKPAWQTDWDRTVELAKKEGRVVVSLTTSAELRAAIEKQFEKRFGIDVEPVVGRA